MELPAELWERIQGFVSPDALLPPSLLAISRLLQRPALDLLLLHADNDAPPHCCQRYDWQHPDFVYRGPAWAVRITRQELCKLGRRSARGSASHRWPPASPQSTPA